MIIAIAAAVPAAILLGLGFVVQQQAAAQQPPTDLLRLRLLAHLARQPRWLLGIATMVAGQVLGAMALSKGSLGLVEPLLAANLLFALAISALWKREHLAPREWLGALTLAGGLGGFVAAAAPDTGGVLTPPGLSSVLSLAVIAAVAAALVLWSRLGTGAPTATKIAAAAGVLFGLQDALTRRTLAALPLLGVLGLIGQWPTYTLVPVAVGGLLLAQSAFEAAPLRASLPAMTLVEPVTGIGLGAAVFAEHLDLSPVALGLEVFCLAVAALGAWLVGTSPKLVHGSSPAVRSAEGVGGKGGAGWFLGS
jgi:drug/metabolite transporter (DMT)-like permease